MRLVVYGAGAIGGVVGGRLAQHGHDVVFIARGAHFDVIKSGGLRLQDPGGDATLDLPAVDHPASLDLDEDDVVLLTVKSQDTAAALAALVDVAPPTTPIFCLQNGVDNERVALRHFSNVYGVAVMCPTSHLEPGVVQAHSTPVTGILDLGLWPGGVDHVAGRVAAVLSASTFVSEPRQDIARWKYRKLLTNLGNAVEAVCGPEARGGAVGRRAAQEGEACLDAAGIVYASEEEDRERRGDLLTLRPVAGERRRGGSSWQSLARRTGAIETDYINGEIVLIGRLHGVPTPVNALLQRLANDLARRGQPPGTIGEDEVLDRLSQK